MTPPFEPTAAFAELGHIKLGETDLRGVLSRVADLAKKTVPGVGEVSVTLVRGARAHTAAYTGQPALQLDEAQYEAGDGPCLTAAAARSTVLVQDMSGDRRWPDWSRQAASAGVGSSLSIGLPIEEQMSGALNIYGDPPHAFDAEAVALAQTFAGYAAVALANAHLYDATASLVQHMQTAMASRAVIEQAKGIVMGQRRCTAEEAFAILTKISQDSNRKLRDVAATLVERVQNRSRIG
jgi:GAF domain-containing protein